MTIKKAISILEQWKILFYHNDDGTDPDSHEMLTALQTVLPVLRAKDTRWIRTRDRLPEKDGSYIVCSGKSGAVFTAHFWAQSKAWSGRSNGKYITHWMPLPEPPVYEKEDSAQ